MQRNVDGYAQALLCTRAGPVRCSITDGTGEDTRFTLSPPPLFPFSSNPRLSPFRVGRFMFV